MLVEALIAVCLVGAGVVMAVPDRYAGRLALAVSVLPVVGSLYMYVAFDGSGNALLGGDIAYETFFEWLSLGPYTVNYHMGLDGISLPLVVLSTVLTTLAILSAWTPVDDRESQFYGLMLFMEASLIGVWGGPRRKYAAIKFFVYTNIASLAMFIGFFGLIFGLGDAVSSTGLPEIAQALRAGQLSALAIPGGAIPADALALGAFLAMFVGFAVKVPVVPFHTWLPDAHVEAPTPASVMLAGVLLKMGTYALLRFNFTMLPEQASLLAVPIAAIAVVSVIYGALLALAQSDLKRVVAYSSVSSMGYVILGLIAYTEYGVGGATFQMVAHGLISGLLFMTVGVFYNATHTRMVGDMSGLADRMPVTASVFVAGAFAYMGLPLMAGFAAELFIFIGAFRSTVLPAAPLFTAAAMFGIVVVAGYLLWAIQRSLFGPYRLETDYDVGRAPVHDLAAIVTLVGLIVLLGTAPELLYDMMSDATVDVVEMGGELP